MSASPTTTRRLVPARQDPPFNFCSRTWTTDEPCEDYADTGGEHLCGENAHVSGHVHTCSCTAETR